MSSRLKKNCFGYIINEFQQSVHVQTMSFKAAQRWEHSRSKGEHIAPDSDSTMVFCLWEDNTQFCKCKTCVECSGQICLHDLDLFSVSSYVQASTNISQYTMYVFEACCCRCSSSFDWSCCAWLSSHYGFSNQTSCAQHPWNEFTRVNDWNSECESCSPSCGHLNFVSINQISVIFSHQLHVQTVSLGQDGNIATDSDTQFKVLSEYSAHLCSTPCVTI